MAPRNRTGSVLPMNDSIEPVQATNPIEEALSAFLSFRESDMDLWRRAGAALNLSSSAALVLSIVLRSDENGAPVRQVDVQRLARLSAAGTSAIADDLVRRCLIARIPHPNDGRAVLLVAGADAGPIMAKINRVDDEFRALAAELSPEALAGVIHVLDGMRRTGDSEYQAAPGTGAEPAQP